MQLETQTDLDIKHALDTKLDMVTRTPFHAPYHAPCHKNQQNLKTDLDTKHALDTKHDMVTNNHFMLLIVLLVIKTNKTLINKISPIERELY